MKIYLVQREHAICPEDKKYFINKETAERFIEEHTVVAVYKYTAEAPYDRPDGSLCFIEGNSIEDIRNKLKERSDKYDLVKCDTSIDTCAIYPDKPTEYVVSYKDSNEDLKLISRVTRYRKSNTGINYIMKEIDVIEE